MPVASATSLVFCGSGAMPVWVSAVMRPIASVTVSVAVTSSPGSRPDIRAGVATGKLIVIPGM